MKSPQVGLYSVLLLLSLVATCCLSATSPLNAQTPQSTRPNIIFILADDLGWGDLGCYGQKTLESPNIDRLAREGIRFNRFYAGSTVCAPSRCVLMTGLHTGHCYIRANGKKNLRPTDLTVAEVLKDAGYRTGLVGKWGIGHERSSGLPTRQGFDHFFGYLDQHHAHNYWPSFLVRNGRRVFLRNVVPGEGKWGQGVASEKRDYSHDLFTTEALEFISRSSADPFFLFLSYTIPHANNEAGRAGMEIPELGEFSGRDWPEPEKGFAAMLRRLDRDVGRIMDLLVTKEIDDNTLVMFSSDNGPHNEGGHRAKFFDSNGPLRGTKRDLFEGGIRVPLVARWPGKIKSGTTSNHIAWFADLMATTAELAGTKLTRRTDGLSFVPTLVGRDGDQENHDHLYWEFHEGRSSEAVLAGDWKAIRTPRGKGPVQLYNLSSDLGETRDLAAEHPELVARFSRTIDLAHEPEARTHYKGREIASTMHWLGAEWLMRATREREEKSSRMLEHLAIKPGWTVADVGAGNGYHSLQMAPIVGKNGTILATDIQPEMLEMLQGRARKAGVSNIKAVRCSSLDSGLTPQSCDLILMVDVYHELDRPELTLTQLRRALKPTGRLVLVEFRSEDPKVPIKKLHKMSKKQILKELLPNGFKLVDDFDKLPWQHVMSFERTGSGGK